MTSAEDLLAPLTAGQQRLVDVVAEASLVSEHEWPFFDYVEGVLDDEGLDAWEVLQSFPEVGRWRYGAVVWSQSGGAKPTGESEVALTVLGMWHAPALREYVPVFFALIGFLAERRRQVRPQPRTVRSATVTSAEFEEWWQAGRRLPLPARLVWQLREHEPPTRRGGSSYQPDGSWTTSVARELLAFEGVAAIDDYVAGLVAYLVEPAPPLPPLLPSPLTLAAALDYLDVVWRLTHERRLFEFRSAERTTRLAFDVQTADEFAAHLSALADILREANKRAAEDSARKGRDHPLARLKADVTALVDEEARPRVAAAIRILELVVGLRDAGQHGAAGDRGLEAFRELNLAYPPVDWRMAWNAISTRTVGALNSLREELDAVSP